MGHQRIKYLNLLTATTERKSKENDQNFMEFHFEIKRLHSPPSSLAIIVPSL